MKLYRQGDVLLEEVEIIPADAKVEPGELILAEGEVTGHAHKIRSVNARILSRDNERYLAVKSRPVQLRHEEHATVTVPPGNYRIVRQREYSPEAIRNVAD